MLSKIITPGWAKMQVMEQVRYSSHGELIIFIHK